MLITVLVTGWTLGGVTATTIHHHPVPHTTRLPSPSRLGLGSHVRSNLPDAWFEIGFGRRTTFYRISRCGSRGRKEIGARAIASPPRSRRRPAQASSMIVAASAWAHRTWKLSVPRRRWRRWPAETRID